jgi:phenylalanyl-tRNA synthetase beta chain
VRSLAAGLGAEVEVSPAEHPPFHPGRCAALVVHGAVIGHAGEVDPRAAAAYDLSGRVAAAEIALEPLLVAVPGVEPATALSTYPPATIDIALVVASDVAAGEVEAALLAGAGELVEALRLFDVYQGEQAGAGRKSLAFSLRLRAPDRTLTTEEISAVRDAAVAEAARRHGAELRA